MSPGKQENGIETVTCLSFLGIAASEPATGQLIALCLLYNPPSVSRGLDVNLRGLNDYILVWLVVCPLTL